jgi:hypothetical protein
METTKKVYPTDEEVAKVMEERKLNRIGAVQYLRRQAAKVASITQPVELNKKLAELGDKAPHVAAKNEAKPKAEKTPKAPRAKKPSGKERYEQLKKEGRCVSCGKEKAYPGRVEGAICIEMAVAYRACKAEKKPWVIENFRRTKAYEAALKGQLTSSVPEKA